MHYNNDANTTLKNLGRILWLSVASFALSGCVGTKLLERQLDAEHEPYPSLQSVPERPPTLISNNAPTNPQAAQAEMREALTYNKKLRAQFPLSEKTSSHRAISKPGA